MINIKTSDEIEKMRSANQIVARILMSLKGLIKEGATTIELDAAADEMVKSEGAVPSFKGYRGFPKSLCTSINSEVVHGIPCDRKLKNGDIISLDMGAELEGYYGDAAVTIAVGNGSDEAMRLIRVTREALYKGIEHMREGNHLSDISSAIQSHAESGGFSVVKDYVGHGIGTKPHEDPPVPNYGPRGQGPVLKTGMVLAIEPMINAGSHRVKVLEDKWTVVTRDGRLSAHFEHSVAITKNGPDVLSELAA
ncbi:MAG: type I methionyl aminopeptidase [bacterium]|nr:MAG: type I methionyl aminopeptidase [bacterium]